MYKCLSPFYFYYFSQMNSGGDEKKQPGVAALKGFSQFFSG